MTREHEIDVSVVKKRQLNEAKMTPLELLLNDIWAVRWFCGQRAGLLLQLFVFESTIFSVRVLLETNENRQKEAGIGPF